ncbi:hypothetical protein [Thermogemmatispora sp.]|uniref:hypothetical protein n=1 Tax=Thermogemmatispora sp. TaxID=1968838 RepID=UPI002ACBDF12|nr:hypothetical protein [Thermogemmatispora sp.]
MAELAYSTGSPDPQHPLNAVLFPDRAGFPHESPADPPAAATSARQQETAAVSPAPSPRCAMALPASWDPVEVVHVPFIEVRDPFFVDGYRTGTRAYFELVWDEQQDRLGRLLSDEDVIAEVEQTLREAAWKAAEQAPATERAQWLAWTAGYLGGFLSARIPSPLPLYGNCRRCHQPMRVCGHCPRCEPCTCPRPGTGSQVAH